MFKEIRSSIFDTRLPSFSRDVIHPREIMGGGAHRIQKTVLKTLRAGWEAEEAILNGELIFKNRIWKLIINPKGLVTFAFVDINRKDEPIKIEGVEEILAGYVKGNEVLSFKGSKLDLDIINGATPTITEKKGTVGKVVNLFTRKKASSVVGH